MVTKSMIKGRKNMFPKSLITARKNTLQVLFNQTISARVNKHPIQCTTYVGHVAEAGLGGGVGRWGVERN